MVDGLPARPIIQQSLLSLLKVIGDFNREALGIEVDFSLPFELLIHTLERIIEWRGSPKVIRCDNEPENNSHSVQQWAQNRTIRLEYIEPGKR